MLELKQFMSDGMPGAMSFDAYFELSQNHATEGKTSGETQSDSLIEYTRLNAHRMKRISKTTKISEELAAQMSGLTSTQTWLVFSETWCGDAAQNLPVISKIAELSDLVELKVIFRDEHPALMDRFLTNGGRSIPKLVAVSEHDEVLFTWGPRPSTAQEMVMDWKSSPEPRKPYAEFVVELQKWYTQDKSASLQKEFFELVRTSNLAKSA